MFVEIAISEEERNKIMGYAQSEKVRMDRAYAELIRLGMEQIVGRGEKSENSTYVKQ